MNRENVDENTFFGSVENLLNLMQEFYGKERGVIFSRKFISRFIAPYQVNPINRKRLLTLLDKSSVMEEIRGIVHNSFFTLPKSGQSVSQSQM
jgi:hypothetical protein